MSTITNQQRAIWAETALRAFAAATGTEQHHWLCDLLCDLMHWADCESIDFDATLETARGHHREEAATRKGGQA